MVSVDGLESRVPTDGSSNVHSMMLLAVNSVLTVELASVYGFTVVFVGTKNYYTLLIPHKDQCCRWGKVQQERTR